MKTWILLLFMLGILADAPCAAAQELRADVNVSGRQVEIHVRNQDGEPADGVPVRLLYGRQLALAGGHTDHNGRWAHTLSDLGAYEAVIETGSRPDEVLRLPFTVLVESEFHRVPWLKAGLCLLCFGGTGLLVVANIRRAGAVQPVRLMLLASLPAAGTMLLGCCAWLDWNRQASAGAPGPDLSAAARKFLRKREVQPLSASLEQLLRDKSVQPAKTQPHPLLNQLAPDFQLMDHHQKTWSLHERLTHGPVVLVFYYGYHCNHCVGQLFALHDDIKKFRELGAEVLAISADPPELTRDRSRQYGEFAFPVLTDPGNHVGRVYGVYQPASATGPEDLKHGTFVIARDGRVRWVHTGYEPFTDNRTLLIELATPTRRASEGVDQ